MSGNAISARLWRELCLERERETTNKLPSIYALRSKFLTQQEDIARTKPVHSNMQTLGNTIKKIKALFSRQRRLKRITFFRRNSGRIEVQSLEGFFRCRRAKPGRQLVVAMQLLCAPACNVETPWDKANISTCSNEHDDDGLEVFGTHQLRGTGQR